MASRDDHVAERTCRHGAQRFPDDPRFAQCQIILMAVASLPPDADRAQTLARQVTRARPDRDAHAGVLSALLAAAVQCRSGLWQEGMTALREARAAVPAGRGSDVVDVYEALARSICRDTDGTVRLFSHATSLGPQRWPLRGEHVWASNELVRGMKALWTAGGGVWPVPE